MPIAFQVILTDPDGFILAIPCDSLADAQSVLCSELADSARWGIGASGVITTHEMTTDSVTTDTSVLAIGCGVRTMHAPRLPHVPLDAPVVGSVRPERGT